MRLVAGVLAVILFAPAARADQMRASDGAKPRRPLASPPSPAAPPQEPSPSPPPSVAAPATSAPRSAASPAASAPRTKVPLRVVRVMPESRQALLFDRTRDTHVLAEVGRKIDGYVVEAIDEDEVTLRFNGKQIILAAPAAPAATAGGPATKRGLDDGIPARSAAQPGPAQNASGATEGGLPVDPYDPPIRVVQAPGTEAAASSAAPPAMPIQPGEGGVRVVQAPAGGGRASSPINAGDDGVRVARAPGAPPAATDEPFSVAVASDAAATGAPAIATAATESPAIGSAAEAAPLAPPEYLVEPPAADKRTVDARAMADVFTAAPSAGPAVSGSPVAASTCPTGTAKTAKTAKAATAPSRAATTPATVAGVRPASPPSAPAGAILLSRTEVDAALGNFATLASALRASFSSSGLVIEAVADGTIFQRAGLRSGDVITAIDGASLRSLDDAATLYARAATARSITAQLLRGGKPITLHVAIQ